jgi:hypothetical protein
MSFAQKKSTAQTAQSAQSAQNVHQHKTAYCQIFSILQSVFSQIQSLSQLTTN